MTDDLLSDLRIALARIEERQETAARDRDTFTKAVEALATKEDVGRIEKHLSDRVAKVEATQSMIVRGALAGSAAVMGGLYAVGRKLGITT